MSILKKISITSLALVSFAVLGCEKRETRTETTSTTTTTPAATETDTMATTDRVPEPLDERQPVAGHESTVPSGSETPTTASETPTITTTTSDIYVVRQDGTRTMLHDTVIITDLQRKLSTDGVYQGATDGQTSPELSASIREYQRKHELEQTGTLDRSTAEKLGMKWDQFTSAVKEGASDLGSDVKRVSGEAADDVKAGATELGRDIKEGTSDTARELKEGAAKVEDRLDTKPETE
jgi:hypothetical protein